MITAGLAYGISAVPRNDLATGQLGPLVLFALLPYLLLLVIRAGRFETTGPPGRRQLLGLAIVTAVASAWFPPAALVVIAAALALVHRGDLHRRHRAPRCGASAPRSSAGSAPRCCCFPWTGTASHGPPRPGRVRLHRAPPASRSAELIRFQTGPAGAGVAGFGLLAAAALALLLATGPAWRGWCGPGR